MKVTFKSLQHKTLFLLGFLAPIPFFLIPETPYIYVNWIIEDLSWLVVGVPPYTGFTGSLGLAAPLVLPSVFVAFLLFLIDQYRFYKNELIQALLLMFVFSVITVVLSGSIKVMGPLSSFMGFFMVCFLSSSDHWKPYAQGFFWGLSFFCISHMASIFIYGVKFSLDSEGISIFSLEIYQALVSYAALISYFFGTLLINNDSIVQKVIGAKNIIIARAFYFIVIISLLTIIATTSRRLSIVVCLGACAITYTRFVLENRPSMKSKFNLMVLLLPVVFFLIVKNFYGEQKTMTYNNMVAPRLNAYLDKMQVVIDGSTREVFFGVIDGWANIENGILDIIMNVGLVGLTSFFIVFVCAGRMLKKLSLPSVVWDSRAKSHLVFSAFVMFLNNTVNNAISTPYFFICFLIIFTHCLKLNLESKG